MSFRLIREGQKKSRLLTMADLKNGQIAVIVDGGYPGTCVMRKYDKVFSISPDDNHYWSVGAHGHVIELIEPGERVILEVI